MKLDAEQLRRLELSKMKEQELLRELLEADSRKYTRELELMTLQIQKKQRMASESL